jgi:hypothetical protein
MLPWSRWSNEPPPMAGTIEPSEHSHDSEQSRAEQSKAGRFGNRRADPDDADDPSTGIGSARSVPSWHECSQHLCQCCTAESNFRL